MKKIILTAAAIFAFGLANAQEVKFGIKAGLNLSNVTGDVDGASTKVGFQAGGLVEIKVSDKFAVQPELLYSLQGAKVDEEGTEVDFNLSYLNIPVMAKYLVSDKFSLEAGPQVGFLMSAKAKAEGASVDVKDAFESIDFGLNIGAGYDATENINIGVRYGFGLSNIAKDSEGEKIKNSNIAIAVAYKF